MISRISADNCSCERVFKIIIIVRRHRVQKPIEQRIDATQ